MKSDIDKEIVERVKALRLKLNYTQRTLAEVIGRTPGFVGQVESEKYGTKYSAEQLYKLAKQFGCSVSDLFPPIDPLEP